MILVALRFTRIIRRRDKLSHMALTGSLSLFSVMFTPPSRGPFGDGKVLFLLVSRIPIRTPPHLRGSTRPMVQSRLRHPLRSRVSQPTRGNSTQVAGRRIGPGHRLSHTLFLLTLPCSITLLWRLLFTLWWRLICRATPKSTCLRSLYRKCRSIDSTHLRLRRSVAPKGKLVL